MARRTNLPVLYLTGEIRRGLEHVPKPNFDIEKYEVSQWKFLR